MEFNEVVVKENLGLCRCCLSEGCYKDVCTEYTWMNETEIYAEMLMDCFDISIMQHSDGPNGASRLICEVCITRLRDACNFKKQVQETEKKFIDMISKGEFQPKALQEMKSEVEVEVEPETGNTVNAEYLEDEMDFSEAVKEDSDSDYEQPGVSRAATPPKKKRLKKIKIEPPKKDTAMDIQADSKLIEREKKHAMIQLMTVLIQNSTVMPFKWYGNRYMCFYCGCPFSDCVKLKQHTKEEHQTAKLENLLKNIKYHSSRVKFDVSEIKCKRCLQPFADLDGFMTHASEMHSLKFDRGISRSFFIFKLSEENMSCLDCGQNFRFFGPLLNHSHRYHNKAGTYLCEICGKGFIAKVNVDSHIRNVHPETNQSQCEQCNKSFPNLYALKIHLEKVHKIEKLKCPKCSEVLGSRYLKRRHMALVHDVKTSQHICDLCPKVFTIKNKLDEHKRRVHLKEKTFACEICGFRVFNKELLKRHLVKHDDARPFECDFCKKTFSRKRTMDIHRRIHTNDRRYVCADCGRAFVQVSSLKLHIRVHHTYT